MNQWVLHMVLLSHDLLYLPALGLPSVVKRKAMVVA
jgi:hypothetical protein